MPHAWGRFSWVLPVLLALAWATAPAQMAPAPMTPEKWEADLDALAQGLLDRHPNFYTTHTVEEFEDALGTLHQRLHELDDEQIVMELSRLVAMGGDAHTTIGMGDFQSTMHRLPIQLTVLSDGVFVTAADEPVRDLIGARLVSIQGVDAMNAIERVSVLFAYENRSKQVGTGAGFVTLLPALAATGVIDDHKAKALAIVIEQTGAEGTAENRELILDCSIPADGYRWRSFMESLPQPWPVAYRRSRGNYQSEFIEEHQTMYVAYNRCREAEDLPMAGFVEFIMSKSDQLGARRIIIDLRFNGGGDETVIWPLWQALEASERFSDPGDIIGLISPRTFSSAMSNSHQLRDNCGAVLIGEPTGGKPNHFGQLSSFTLPNSGLTVMHSTRWFQKVEGDPDAVYPDVGIEWTGADLFGGRDPVLEAALGYAPPPEPEPEPTGATDSTGG
ncbi:MAG: hypothetical protein WD114_06775 [Phycisphaerales bacterium]